MNFVFSFRALLSLLLLLYANHPSVGFTQSDRYFKAVPPLLRQNVTDEYVEVTIPLPSDRLEPSCSILLLQHDFANTIGRPRVSVGYSPPVDCPGPWSHVVLEFRASCKGEQYDRIAGVWLDGVEILRTSTAEPTESGIFWKVRKDITRYSSLLLRSNLALAVMLENIVNNVFTGVYHVNISVFYYREDKATVVPYGVADGKYHRKLGVRAENIVDQNNKGVSSEISVDEFRNSAIVNSGHRLGFGYDAKPAKDLLLAGRSNSKQNYELLYEKPADAVIPISDDGGGGFWFRIQNGLDVPSKGIRVPPNTCRAVLEIYASFHGNDEFWYSNPPDSYIKQNNLTTGRGHGAFRQIFVTINGAFVWSEVPFPVIFTGGINPLFWEPVVAIGAFNLPSYNVELTPYLGLLLDGEVHSFGLGVTDSIPFWLVDANLHLWLDPHSSSVQARTVLYPNPALSVRRKSIFVQLDGSFKIKAKQKIQFLGWVNSSAGNFTTHFTQRIKFKNLIKFKRNGTQKEVKQKIKTKTKLKVEDDTGRLLVRATIKKKYPLLVITTTIFGSDNSTYLSVTNVSHALNERSRNGDLSSSFSNIQVSGGCMVVKDHSVLSGAANTHQILTYKDKYIRFSRTVAASNGSLSADYSTFAPSS